MAKKFSLLLAAVAVVAFAVPSMASAAQITGVGVGGHVVGRSNDTFTFTSIGTLECEEVVIEGEITANSGGTVAANGIGTGETFNCFSEGEPILITDATLLNLHTTGPANGTVGLTFEADLPVVGTCHYGGTVALTYVSGSDELHIEGPLTASPAACGTAEIEGDFTIEKAGGGAVVLD
jgi:hypothetical protein